MGIKCPKCHFDNPDDTVYCGKCGTRLPSSEEITIPQTETLETPTEELTRGTIFAGRHEIIEELGGGVYFMADFFAFFFVLFLCFILTSFFIL